MSFYVFFAAYMSTTLGTENEGGVLLEFWFNVIGSRLPN